MTFIPHGRPPNNYSSAPITKKQAAINVLYIIIIVLAAIPLLYGIDRLLSAISHDLPHKAVSVIILSGFAGVFAGIAGAVLNTLLFKPHLGTKSFLSAYFNKSLADIEFDSAFWGRIVIGGLVGWMVGAWLAASGFTTAPELFQGVYTLDNLIPKFGGGFGGAPPPDSIFGIVILFLLVIISSCLAGLICGYLVNIALSILAGITKGAVKAYIEKLISSPGKASSYDAKVGAMGGLFIGMISGVIQVICTVIGIIRFTG